MPSSSATMRSITITLPEQLADQVESAAAAEQHSVSELVSEAFHAYKVQRALAALDALTAMAASAQPTEYGPEDVYRLLREVRAEDAATNNGKVAA